jgi:UDP-glucose:glycoprotein glucosyltransferase
MASSGICYRVLQQLLMLLLLGVLISVPYAAHGKGIHVTVEASWNETSLLQEGCEWAGRNFGARAFYSCVEAVWGTHRTSADGAAAAPANSSSGVTARYSTQQAQYSAVREVVQTLLETQLADTPALFEMEMAARVYSPAVEAHYAAAVQALSEVATVASPVGDEEPNEPTSECPCGEPFAVIYTRAGVSDGSVHPYHVCSAAALKATLRTLTKDCQQSQCEHSNATGAEDPSSSFVFSSAQLTSVQDVSLPRLDYRYPSFAAASDVAVVVVLYGLLGSPVTRELHEAAVQAATQGEGGRPVASTSVAYFFRHLPVSPTRLCGAHSVAEAATWHADGQQAALLRVQWDVPLAVQGYGVTVDIKNREYKVLDEKAAAQQKAKEEAEGTNAAQSAGRNGASPPVDQADHVVGGFYVQRLKQRYPHLAMPLNELATVMEEEVGSSDMKVDFDVWELQSIGLAATQYIREVENSSRRLHVLHDVVNRFPMYAAALSRIAAQPDRYTVVQKTLASVRPRLPPGASALFVDGWRVEEKDLSLFGVLDALRADEVLSHHVKRVLTTRVVPRTDGEANEGPAAAGGGESSAVSAVRVEPAMLERVSSYVKHAARRAVDANGANSASDSAFAIPDSHVVWLNDVETEERFEGMSKQLKTFFTQTPGVIPFPRRNLLNYVFIWNPLLKSHLQMLTMIYRFNQQGLLARYGLLLLDPVWSPEITPEGGMTPAGSTVHSAGGGVPSFSHDVFAISALAYHLVASGQPERLLEVLMQLLQAAAAVPGKVGVIPSHTVQQVCHLAAKTMLEVRLDELMGSVDFVNHYHETQAMLRRFPMTSYPASLLNGVVFDPFGGQFNGELQYEVLRLRNWVASGALRDDMGNLYAAILQLRGAADHLQPALLRPPQTMLWSTTHALVAYVADAPYLYSPAYAFDVPSLTLLVTLPCRTTVATLRQLQTVLSALQACAEVTDENDPFYAVCRRLRASVVVCPAVATVTQGEDASSGHPAVYDPASVSDYVVVLLRQMIQRDVAETRRASTLQRYVTHLLKAVSISPTAPSQSHPRCNGTLCRAAVAAALAHDPLPADLQVHDSAVVDADYALRHRSGVHDFWAALEAAGPVSDVNVTLVTNGRVVRMDDTFTARDVLEAARQALPMTVAIEEAVLKVNFAEMDVVGAYGGSSNSSRFTPEEIDNAFYSGKIACLTSVFTHEVGRHEAAKSASSLMREEALFATPEDRKKLRAVLFTVNNTPTSSTSGGAATNDAAAPAAGSGEVLHEMTAVVDPSSRDAQLIVSLASYLMQTPLRLRLTVLLNPSMDVKFPIRDFYEYVASATLLFDASTGRVVAPAATFAQLPTTALLTLGVEEPPTWTVFSQEASEDLDNILLSRLPPGTLFVFAAYRMHSILVTGDTTDVHTGAPPDGLPLSLTPAPHTSSGAAYSRSTDTQVMANQHGYYQLQAAPGVWYLSVKPGPVAAAYCIETIGTRSLSSCADSKTDINFTQGQRIPIVVNSFSGRYLSLQVRHTPVSTRTAAGRGGQPGEEREEDVHDILQRMASAVTHKWPPPWSSRGAKPQPPVKPTLNIFSVASGHLYERFLRMMFYSVHKTSSDKYGANTTRIKFWVIENFLSPQFKRYIPLLAAELGFEVGFVTYRWPWWLPRQTEKQRKIWAYKILFLDVIFPLDVDRIIFVDADQTAQADLHELYNMDIGRSPVAMTPFCQTYRNEDTVRFRFWEHGFWVDHLKGKPYHISAIFLVDLRQFRAMLAGDRYRSTYANLAGDPNSLSNLDQDLPNYLQASIPIFSLPEQWLWCETWCSAKSKSRAKTIDLCNNPLTKMPKLDNAKMVIPGWEDLDNKLQNLSDSLMSLS